MLLTPCQSTLGLLDRRSSEPDPQMSARSFAPARVAHRYVPDWLHVQFLLGASGTLHSKTLGKGLYACHGEWADRSCLECVRIVKLQGGSVALDRTETTGPTKKAGRANGPPDQLPEAPIWLAAFGSSAEGDFMLNHQLVGLYLSQVTPYKILIMYHYFQEG